MKSLLQQLPIVLFLIGFAASLQAQEDLYQTEALEILYVDQYDHVYSDRGTGAHQDLSTWKPRVSPGYYALGHLAKSGYDAPSTTIMLVKALDRTAIQFPVDYRKVYGDHGTGGDQDGSFWQPIPPEGYVALGMVAAGSYAKPALTDVVCVRSDLVTAANVGGQIWNDGGSGGDMDVSLWQIVSPSPVYILTSNSFSVHPAYGKPESTVVSYGIKLN